MFVILEGNECCFKSTSAKILELVLPGFKVVKGSSFESAKASNEELFAFYKGILDTYRNTDIILDRFYWSNLVYAYIYKDYSILTKEQVLYIQEELCNIGFYQVYCFDNPNSILKRLSIRGDDYIPPELESIKKINACYISKKSEFNIHVDKFYYCGNNLLAHLTEVVNEVKKGR